MPDLASVRDLTWSLFMEPSPPQRAAFDRAFPGLAAAAAEEEPPIERFSVFDERHVERAMKIVARMMRLANEATDEEGLRKVIAYSQQMRGRENPDLVDYALMVFITHHPKGRALMHAVPGIGLRNPELVVPSTVPPERALLGPEMARLAPEPGVLAAVATEFTGGALPTDNLEWFREDPFANEHHIHWHVVYPTSGVPNPANPAEILPKDRQGEIFFYMHEQMLARYDAERVALGHDRVQPLESYGDPVETGYDPGPFLQDQRYGAREPGTSIAGISGYTVADHDQRRQRLGAAIEALQFDTSVSPVPVAPVPIDKVTLLGATVEANRAGIRRTAGGEVGNFYGNLHNRGHMLLSAVSDGELGVMSTPEVAIRDPVFWEWHKHVDDFYAAWQEKVGPQQFSDRPLVRLRKQLDPAAGLASSPDVILAFEDQLPAEAAGEGLAAWARETFGGDHWEEDFSQTAATTATTATLETAMLQRGLTLSDRVTTVPLEHLTHRPFVYVFRIENRVDQRVQATVRVFLAPKPEAADRRAWIEMDKFVHRLEPLEKSIAVRRGSQSSIIRKPAVMKPELIKGTTIHFSLQDLEDMRRAGLPDSAVRKIRRFADRTVLINGVRNALGQDWERFLRVVDGRAQIVPAERPPRPPQNDGGDIEDASYCSCGWPYNLLLPRGTEEGMPFRLAVICSDWEIDQVEGDESCGSLSFCGAREKYPDIRDMGYPFDRPFEVSIADTIMANPNMAFRDIMIRRMPDIIEEDD